MIFSLIWKKIFLLSGNYNILIRNKLRMHNLVFNGHNFITYYLCLWGRFLISNKFLTSKSTEWGQKYPVCQVLWILSAYVCGVLIMMSDTWHQIVLQWTSAPSFPSYRRINLDGLQRVVGTIVRIYHPQEFSKLLICFYSHIMHKNPSVPVGAHIQQWSMRYNGNERILLPSDTIAITASLQDPFITLVVWKQV